MPKMVSQISTVSALFFVLLLAPALAQAQDLPDGFSVERIDQGPFSGRPVAFAFVPDGRIVVLELNSGVIRLAPVGNYPVSSAPIDTIPDVLVEVERGLLGVAVHPAFPAEPHIFVFFSGTDGFSHVTRFTASGALTDSSSTAVTLSDRYEVLLIPDFTESHNGGTLRFGPDGHLYVSIGDDLDKCTAQDPGNLNGSILRLDISALPDTAGGPPPKSLITPADNPLPGPDENERLVWAYGLRNPFRFTVDALSNNVYIGDVGQILQEEIDERIWDGATAPNYGWPWFEGELPGITCDTVEPFTDPIHVYDHDEFIPANVTGGPLYRTAPGSGLTFPPEYDGNYFFIEPNLTWMRRLEKNGGTWEIAPMVPGQSDSTKRSAALGGYSTDMQVGADGAIYFMVFSTATLQRGVWRIVSDYSTSVEAIPVKLVRPAATAVPNPAFAGRGTTVRYSLPGSRSADLYVYDVTGRLVRRIVGGAQAEGSLRWDGRTSDGRTADAGVYFYRVLREGGQSATGKVTLIR